MADTDTTIYLFGTIHMLPPGSDWRSQAVFLEADVVSDPAGQVAMIQRLGRLPPGERLTDQLTPDLSSKLRVAAGRLGVPMEVLEPLRPWFAAVSLANEAIRSAGYSSEGGVEAGLRDEARSAGKDLRYLETMESQLSALADLTPEVQAAYLEFTLADIDTAESSLGQMAAAWRSGDENSLNRVLIEDDMARLPALKEALLDFRNKDWAQQLAALLRNEPGEFFIAVGVAHLVGPDSVQKYLKALGIETVRIQ
jgi:hypothetical protein